MNFECRELTITDSPEFGCTIEFNDKIENLIENLTIEEQLTHSGKYLIIQRSYPEDEYEIDWYAIECSEIEIDFNQKDNMYVKLNKNKFEIYCSGVTIITGLNLTDKEYSELNKIIRTRFKDKVVMLKE